MNNQNHLTFETNQSNDNGFTCVFLADWTMTHSPEESAGLHNCLNYITNSRSLQ